MLTISWTQNGNAHSKRIWARFGPCIFMPRERLTHCTVRYPTNLCHFARIEPSMPDASLSRPKIWALIFVDWKYLTGKKTLDNVRKEEGIHLPFRFKRGSHLKTTPKLILSNQKSSANFANLILILSDKKVSPSLGKIPFAIKEFRVKENLQK